MMYGEVADEGRGTIRLHGGGTGLPNPYAPDQPLVPTQGCVRMRNRDVNALIQSIKRQSPEERLQFIFMGSEEYLRTLATDTRLADKPWWNVLRRNLQIPPSPPAELLLASSRTSSPRGQELFRTVRALQVDPHLIELIKTFAEDSGPRGRTAFSQLRQRIDELSPLRNTLPANDALRPMIAFTLCYAGLDCAANIAVIESAFNKPSPFEGFYADQAQEMLSRLTDKANQDSRQTDVKNLILKLLTVAPDADGALAEGLGVTLSLKLRDQTRSFVAAIDELAAVTGSRSVTIKTSALDLIRAADYLTRNDVTNIARQIEANSTASLATKSTFTEFRRSYLQTHQISPELASGSIDLSGTYTGTFNCDVLGLTGPTTLTITGNEFTTADGGTGRIVTSTTRGYTSVALQLHGPVVSLRARKSGNRLTLTATPGSRVECSFVPGRRVER